MLLLYLVDINGQCSTVRKSISAGSTNVQIPRLASCSYQPNLLCQRHLITSSTKIPNKITESTRENSLIMFHYYCHYNPSKFSFCNRIMNVWNSLPSLPLVHTIIFTSCDYNFWRHNLLHNEKSESILTCKSSSIWMCWIHPALDITRSAQHFRRCSPSQRTIFIFYLA